MADLKLTVTQRAKVTFWVVRPIATFAATFVVFTGGIVHIVWWQLSHNLINVGCSNNIYLAHHLQTCAVWSRASGIVTGVDLPLIFLGFLGMIAAVVWLVSDR
jgi:hypothetical protein